PEKRSSKRSLKRSSKHPDKGTAKSASPSDDTQSLSPKQQLIQDRAAAAIRQKNITFVTAVFLGCAFLGGLVGLLVAPKIGAALGGGLLCLILSFKYQRLALYAFIIYIPFGGTITYELGGSALLQLAKDIFYIPVLIGVYQFCRKNRLPLILPKAIKPPLIVLLIIVLITALITNVPDQIGGVGGQYPAAMALLGIKLLFGYVPVVACIYYLIRDKSDLVGLLRLQTVLVLVACSLGAMQYFMLKTGMCAGTTGTGSELFRASLDARCFVGGSLLYSPDQGQIRLPGTFVAPWQWGWFLISAAFFSFGTTFSDKSAFWRLVGLVSLVAVMIMATVSGQRVALVTVPAAVALLTVITGQVANLKRFVPIGVVLGLILTYLVVNNPAVLEARIDSLESRWSASPPQQFMVEQFSQVWKKQEGIFGHGVGRATNSARSFGDTSLIETYHPKLIYEIGPLGLIAALAVYTVLTVVTFRVYRKTKDKNLRSYAASMWVFVLFISYCPYYYPLDVDPVAVYYWLAAGIVLKIPELERQEQEKAAAALDPAAAETTGKSGQRRRKKATPTFG
ncbi:MAG: hormogonium polysaccharide biosynthesis protein HpsL, partial [Phormidesmis sp.]